MTVIMIGAAGFLGGYVLREHLRAGRHVTVLAHGDPGATRDRLLERLRPPRAARLDIVAADVTQDALGLPEPLYRTLAARAEEIWHLAAHVVLHGRDEEVWRLNVTGTANVLRFAAATPAPVPLRYVSTAFVAGRTQGRVREGAATGADGFENTYERSKHTAERAVRRWARYGPALILRPSILVPPGAPVPVRHTLGTVEQILASVASRDGGTDPRLVLRVAADPRAHLNLVPVDWAARAMVQAAANAGAGDGAPALHITHPRDIPVRSIAAALEDLCPVRLRMMPARPAAPTRSEQVFYRRAAGFLPYLYHRRTFDDSALHHVLPDVPPPPEIDRAYLRAALSPVPLPRPEPVVA